MNGAWQKNRRRRILWSVALLCGGVALALATQRSWAVEQRRPGENESPRLRVAPDDQPPAERERDPQRLIHPRPMPGWVLGVRVDNLQTGVRLTYVLPNSAAWRAGLEVRDVIVSVEGYQVGYVSGRLYDLERELQLRADRSGRVRLLVWNHRDGELVNLDVTLDHQRSPRPLPGQPGIRGQVTFLGLIMPGEKAELVVQLVDITDRMRGRQPVAEQRIAWQGRQPISFYLETDPDQLPPHRRYELLAYLEVDGSRRLATMPGRYLLSQLDDLQDVDMTLLPIRFDRR